MQLELEDVQRNKKPAALLNIDLEKAFDSVWIDGLLYKLQDSGVTGYLLNIIQALLSNRLSFIKIGNYRSNDFPIHIGLPQGTVLEKKDNLRSLAKKKRSKSKNRPSQKKRRNAQKRLVSS